MTGLEQAAEDRASRVGLEGTSWKPYSYEHTTFQSKALCQERVCRAGCAKQETLSNILQQCPCTLWERIKRHDNVVKRIGTHCKALNYEVKTEPHVRHEDGTLFKPDLAIHKDGNNTIILDVGINWEGSISLGLSYLAKKAVYNNEKFLTAARKRWPNRNINVLPVVIGTRGGWPKDKEPTEKAINIPHVKAACINIVIKWAATIHQTFGKMVWSSSTNQRRPHRLT